MLLTSSISFPNLGITVDPSPVAFTIFGKEIYWYGIIIACGFLLAVLYMMNRANTFGLTQDDVLDLVLWAVPIGVVCARLYYCVFYWDLYRDNPISMLYIWEGGLAIYGGIIGGAITVLVLSRVKKIPPLVMLDNASMGVIIGQICGRWGNFMNREAHGSVTDSFSKWALPTQRAISPTTIRRFCMNRSGISWASLAFISTAGSASSTARCFCFTSRGMALGARGSRACARTASICSRPASASASSLRRYRSSQPQAQLRSCF